MLHFERMMIVNHIRVVVLVLVAILTFSFRFVSMKQPIVTLSAAEAEFVAACEAAREILWMRGILHDMGYPQMESSILFEDNTACIFLATSQGKHDRIVSCHYYDPYLSFTCAGTAPFCHFA